MLEAYGNIWEEYSKSQLLAYPIIPKRYDAVVISTNGYVTKQGRCVMGRGIALEAKKSFPGLDAMLGTQIKMYGNHVHRIRYPYITIFSFPVKPEYGPNGEPGWKVNANLDLIARSAKEIIAILDNDRQFVDPMFRHQNILMPRVGAGNGHLPWEAVKKVIEPILDDRFTVMTFHE